MHRILIVEDDISFGTMLRAWMSRNGYDAELVSRMDTARDTLRSGIFSLVMTDLRLPDGDGIMLLGWLRERSPDIPVIIMTGYADVQSAVSAIKIGAFDYLEKPINPSVLKEKIEGALSAGAAQPTPASRTPLKPAEPAARSGIVHGDTDAARKTQGHIKLVSPTRMSVLIIGESGTGKEYVARQIHQCSDRADAPFIAVDCGSLSSELAPSELFGHIKGSFTSAIADKKGVFTEADSGTVFLDEIGNLSYEVQVQLLRALQEKKIRPVGASADKAIDVRIIAATNEDLEAAISAGRFREDLYHRINEFTIEVPPLRERKKDIPKFAGHFLSEACEELGKQISGFSPEALEILDRYIWKGNLRELRNVVRRAALFCNDAVVGSAHLPVLTNPAAAVKNSVEPLRGNDKQRIEEAIRLSGNNKTLAAKMLGIDRKTLYNKIHQYGIEI